MCWERASPAKFCLAEVESMALLSMWDLWFRTMSFPEVDKLVKLWEQADGLCPAAYSCSNWSAAASHDAELNGLTLTSSHSISLVSPPSSPKVPQGLLLWSMQLSSLGNIVSLGSPRSFLHNFHRSFHFASFSQERFLTFPFMTLLKNLSSGCSFWDLCCISHPADLGRMRLHWRLI